MGYYDKETYDEYNGTYVQDFDCHFGYHSEFSVHHLHNLTYLFIVLGFIFEVHSKFWGSYYRTAILFDKLWKM